MSQIHLEYYDKCVNFSDLDLIHQMNTGGKIFDVRPDAIPEGYSNEELLMIHTSRIDENGKHLESVGVGTIIFEADFKYDNVKQFKKDEPYHAIKQGSKYFMNNDNESKYSWTIIEMRLFDKPMKLGKRPGIKYTRRMWVTSM